jgi:radical SAM superfamily enzyme YgiQ (UPF0313 family)
VWPLAWVVFGGNHVSHQGAHYLGKNSYVDVVVNGEGELTFQDLVIARLGGRSTENLSDVAGLSFWAANGSMTTTPDRGRIEHLDDIPSPLLSGALELTDGDGRFLYDVGLLETNRGCPYKCAFCYWGGALGQKVRRFSRDRLRAEVELLAHHGVETIALCDANFGMFQSDLDFVTDVIDIKCSTGFPCAIETSWAKNKSENFRAIVRMMKQAGLKSSFTLALQTLDDAALALMGRRNMAVNKWEELVDWLTAEGLECYAELIWGVPGESIATFLAGYDRLAEKISRIATYPLLLMPNTEYAANRDLHGFITCRGDDDDFEYVLANRTLPFDENRHMQRFLYWSRLIGENQVFRRVWRPLRLVCGLSQSDVLFMLDDWCRSCEDSAVRMLSGLAAGWVSPGSLAQGLRIVFGEPSVTEMFGHWWRAVIEPGVPEMWRNLLFEVFRLDLATMPVMGQRSELLETVQRDGQSFYTAELKLQHDLPVVERAALGEYSPDVAEPARQVVRVYYRTGFENYVDNHEEATHFFGRPEAG